MSAPVTNGGWLECLDGDGQWRPARIFAANRDDGRIQVHFLGLHTSHARWLDPNAATECRPIFTSSYSEEWLTKLRTKGVTPQQPNGTTKPAPSTAAAAPTPSSPSQQPHPASSPKQHTAQHRDKADTTRNWRVAGRPWEQSAQQKTAQTLQAATPAAKGKQERSAKIEVEVLQKRLSVISAQVTAVSDELGKLNKPQPSTDTSSELQAQFSGLLARWKQQPASEKMVRELKELAEFLIDKRDEVKQLQQSKQSELAGSAAGSSSGDVAAGTVQGQQPEQRKVG